MTETPIELAGKVTPVEGSQGTITTIDTDTQALTDLAQEEQPGAGLGAPEPYVFQKRDEPVIHQTVRSIGAGSFRRKRRGQQAAKGETYYNPIAGIKSQLGFMRNQKPLVNQWDLRTPDDVDIDVSVAEVCIDLIRRGVVRRNPAYAPTAEQHQNPCMDPIRWIFPAAGLVPAVWRHSKILTELGAGGLFSDASSLFNELDAVCRDNAELDALSRTDLGAIPWVGDLPNPVARKGWIPPIAVLDAGAKTICVGTTVALVVWYDGQIDAHVLDPKVAPANFRQWKDAGYLWNELVKHPETALNRFPAEEAIAMMQGCALWQPIATE